MKKQTLIGLASLCAAAALVWSVPAAARDGVEVGHNKKPETPLHSYSRLTATPAPEPGTMALLALGLGGLGLARRRRNKP